MNRILNILSALTGMLLVISSCGGLQEEPNKQSKVESAYQVQESKWQNERVATVSLRIRMAPMPTEKFTVLLENYYWDQFRPLGEITVLKGQEVLYQLSEAYAIGLYRLRILEIPNARPIYFIVNGKEEQLHISAPYADFVEGKATIEPEEEVFVLSELIQLHQRKTILEDSLKNEMGRISVINPKYYTLKDGLRKAIEQNSLDFYKELDFLASEFRETYVYDVVLRMLRKQNRLEDSTLYKKYETEPAMMNKNYFEGIEIDNDRYLGHPIFYQSINEYITQYAGELPGEWAASVTYMVNHITDPEIKRMVADYLVFYYLDRKQEEVAKLIAFSHIEGCTEEYFEEIKQSDRYRSGPVVNAKVPDFELPDANGERYSLYKELSETPITLLYFWKSSCPYCEEEHGTINRLNELYADRGLQIIGVSLDIDKKAWLEKIGRHQMSWLNLCDLKGASSSNIYDYAIKSTPSTFIIGTNGTLIAKDMNGRNLLDLFKTYFQKESNG